MLILLDCRPLQQEGPESERRRFIMSCVSLLSAERGVDWLFVVDGRMDAGWLDGIPGSRVVRKRAVPGFGGWRFWYDWRVPGVVKRYKPDLIMMTGGSVAGGTGAVPQCVWMPERAAAKGGIHRSYGRIYEKRLAESLLRAQTVFAFSLKDREFLLRKLSGTEEKILVVPVAGEVRVPLTTGEKADIKDRFTGGKEYFYTDVAGIGQKGVVELLKSFSLFKKRQRSNMQLVLAGKGSITDKHLTELLATYKYREDIHWAVGSEEETFPLTAASYAVLYPFDRDNLGVYLLDAWEAGVPVIAIPTACLPEMAGEAVMYAQPGDQASLAGQLMLIYKDESLRSRLIGKGRDQGKTFSRERSMGEVWAGITSALAGFPSKMSKSAINN